MPEKSFNKLIEIVAKLRCPETGCPWDRKQTVESLMKCVKEEADEVLEAVEKNDNANLKEELGDLMFVLFMVTQVASEEGRFTMKDVLSDAAEKLIRRHTWVFGDDTATTPEEALELWQKNKSKEK